MHARTDAYTLITNLSYHLNLSDPPPPPPPPPPPSASKWRHSPPETINTDVCTQDMISIPVSDCGNPLYIFSISQKKKTRPNKEQHNLLGVLLLLLLVCFAFGDIVFKRTHFSFWKLGVPDLPQGLYDNLSVEGQEDRSHTKLQALVYNILPSTTAIFS